MSQTMRAHRLTACFALAVSYLACGSSGSSDHGAGGGNGGKAGANAGGVAGSAVQMQTAGSSAQSTGGGTAHGGTDPGMSAAGAAGEGGDTPKATVDFDSNTLTWTMTTDFVQKKVSLDKGTFLVTSLLNRSSGRDYVQGSAPAPEFGVHVGAVAHNGASGGYTYDKYSTQTLGQGELELTIAFHDAALAIKQNYVIYPGTGIIQQWAEFQNSSGAAQQIGGIEIVTQRLMSNDLADVDFYYMTGGANFRGSNVLKKEPFTSDYKHSFDSHGFDGMGAPETMTVDGTCCGQIPVTDYHSASGMYHEFFALRNRKAAEGAFVMWDYNGHWVANVGNDGTAPGALESGAQLSNYPLAAGATITSPKSLTGVFSGDLDDMGNAIVGYQYQYKWDYTRDAYFAQFRTSQWLHGAQTPTMFGTVGIARAVGIGNIWIDDSWYTDRGDWDPLASDNFAALNAYAKKSGITLMVWSPPYHADSESTVLQENPGFQLPGDTGSGYGWHLDLSQPKVVTWLLQNVVAKKQAEWGDYMLRIDGQPSFGDDDNRVFDQSRNWYDTLKAMKDQNPRMGLNGNASGGESMSIEIARYSDYQQFTDGQVGHFSTYWVSLLFPADKLSTGYLNWPGYNPAAHGNFHGDPFIQLQDSSAAATPEEKESYRRDVELYNFLKQQGVIGRYVKFYRPTVGENDPTFYLQHMSRDHERGFISIVTDSNPATGTDLVLFPKGLLADQSYTVDSEFGSAATATHSGSEWMSSGIPLKKLAVGELIFFNLTTRPGLGADKTPPAAPSAVTRNAAMYLNHAGQELSWAAGRDEQWLSYYEIFKNGAAIDKVSRGTYYFDVGGVDGDSYQVRTVDGDGNHSDLVSASAGQPTTYRASVGFSTANQGDNGWFYLQWDGTQFTDMIWDTQKLQWLGDTPYIGVYGGIFMHPDTKAAVRAFKVPRAGRVHISGSVAKSNTSKNSDGVNAKILQNGAQVWPSTSAWQYISGQDAVGVTHDLDLDVKAGDMIYFILDHSGNSGYDQTRWDPIIQYE